MKRTPSLKILYAVLAVLTILFFLGGPGYYSSRSFKAFWNLGHILYYVLLCMVVFEFARRKAYSVMFQIATILGVSLVLGVLVELLQGGFNRTPDTGDLFRNMIGAAVGIAFFLPGRKTFSKGALRLLQAISFVLVASQVYPVASALTDEYQARSQFPVLADFESPYELQRWEGSAGRSIDDATVYTGKHAMRVSLDTTLYSGVNLKYFPGDWTGFSQFQCSIFNPEKNPLTITCRINDLAHIRGSQHYEDRYNDSFQLPQGWNTITIDLEDVKNAPVDRIMDMRRIRGVGIFATRLPQPRVIYIDDVRLVR